MNKVAFIILAFLFSFIILDACKKRELEIPETPEIPDTSTVPNEPYELSYGGLPEPIIPSDNPLTVQGVKLGRMLFYETLLSKDNSISCGSCHSQETAFTDTRRFSLGVRNLPGGRQAMTVFNMLWNRNEFFWDGRAHLLRDQSLMPIQDELEMDETLQNVVDKLQATDMYPQQFKNAFGTDEISSELMSLALEQFMNSIVSYNSKYDQYLDGKASLSTEEERGRFLFFTEYNPSFPNASGADCQHCHGGSNFENDKYMNNGLDDDASITDIGRENVSGNAADKAKFKVTSLRNIELTPPYMHDGRFATLEQVVDHYDKVKSSSTLDPSFQQQLPNGLQLSSSDKAALVAFLKTLTDNQLITDTIYSDPFD